MEDLATYPIGVEDAQRFDARVKIVILAFFSVCIFFADTWIGMLVFFLLAASMCAVFRPPISKMLKLGTIVYVIAAFTILFNMFLITPEGFVFSIEGLHRGLFFASRIVLLVLASLIICMTTDALAITAAIRSFLSILRPLKVPVDDIASVLSIALRFIPLTAKEFFSIKEAQWSRGADFDEGPISSIIKAHCAILIPLFINMFRKADSLAMSMDARGYGISTVSRIDISTKKLDARSVAIGLIACCISLLTAIFL